MIENLLDNTERKLFKIISISEVDNNEYNLFCIKHNPKKYDLLDKGVISDSTNQSNNLLSFNSAETLKEIDLSSYTGTPYYRQDNYKLNQLVGLDIDYSFSEQKSSLTYSTQQDYRILIIDFAAIFKFIQARATASVAYFEEIQNVLGDGGGLVCKISLKNQSIKFNIPSSSKENKTIFLGRFDSKNVGFASIGASTYLKLYLYNKDNQILEIKS